MALALKAPEEARQTLRKVDLNIIEAKNKRVRCRVYRDDTGLEKKGKKRKKKRNLSMLRFFFLPRQIFCSFWGCRLSQLIAI